MWKLWVEVAVFEWLRVIIMAVCVAGGSFVVNCLGREVGCAV